MTPRTCQELWIAFVVAGVGFVLVASCVFWPKTSGQSHTWSKLSEYSGHADRYTLRNIIDVANSRAAVAEEVGAMIGNFTSEKSNLADTIGAAFEYPGNLPSNIRIFDSGGTGLKTMRFSLVQQLPSLQPMRHADFLNWLKVELPLEGQSNIGIFNSILMNMNISQMDWIKRYIDAEAEQAGVATDSAKTAYTVSNGFLNKVGLESHWTKNFRQDKPYPLGIPIVDPFDNVDGIGGIDDVLAHFYDAQLRTTSADYPLLTVSCGTFASSIYAESEKSLPTRSPHIIYAGGRVLPQVLQLESGTLDPEEATRLKEEVERIGEDILQDLFSNLADTLKDIAESANWSTHVQPPRERYGGWTFIYPEIATNSVWLAKDPQVNKVIKTVVFSGGMAQHLDLVGRAEKWWQVQQNNLSLPFSYKLTFKLGDRRAPFTGTAAYALDRIIHPQFEQRVFAPKFPNGAY